MNAYDNAENGDRNSSNGTHNVPLLRRWHVWHWFALHGIKIGHHML